MPSCAPSVRTHCTPANLTTFGGHLRDQPLQQRVLVRLPLVLLQGGQGLGQRRRRPGHARFGVWGGVGAPGAAFERRARTAGDEAHRRRSEANVSAAAAGGFSLITKIRFLVTHLVIVRVGTNIAAIKASTHAARSGQGSSRAHIHAAATRAELLPACARRCGAVIALGRSTLPIAAMPASPMELPMRVSSSTLVPAPPLNSSASAIALPPSVPMELWRTSSAVSATLTRSAPARAMAPASPKEPRLTECGRTRGADGAPDDELLEHCVSLERLCDSCSAFVTDDVASERHRSEHRVDAQRLTECGSTRVAYGVGTETDHRQRWAEGERLCDGSHAQVADGVAAHVELSEHRAN
eukprot:scaffold59617_cov79-Phaeocystis_antarctica.AAC.18